uniref:Solute carrier family 13 member 3 n=1 Tax=Oncorhynchus kisutch TaxID=8019 RepID=A0A8C7M739_ONCKI
MEMETISTFAKKLWCVKKQLILVLTPLILLPLIFGLPEKEGKCLYVVLLMAVFWCTEALPLAVTAMLPVCLFPTMGILPSKKVCPQYFLDTNFLFLSGLVMASAIEEWGLHRRIALKVLKIVGVKPAWLILGMMNTSAFLSMWLSNTATTAMMLPIANAILESLFGDLATLKENCKVKEETEGQSQVKLHSLPSEKQILSIDGTDGMVRSNGRTAQEIRTESEYQMKVWKGFLICIPYAASIGGTATLTGTAPNLILIGQLKRLCVKKQDERAQAEKKAEAVIDEDYRKLGPINFAEGSIAFFFILFAVLLFTRDPKFVTGWSTFFNKGYVSDATTGVIIVSILFFFPSQKPSLSWWFDSRASNTPYVPLLSWKKAQECVPWNIILLLGGGFAMAKGCEESGLAAWIGAYLQPIAQVPPAVAVMFITAFLACFTEFASNTATIIIFLPVIAELAMFVKVNPLYFMIPATTGCSFAFMLPVSTPPNSIAFASGHLLVKDMVKTGFVMNILGILSVSLAMNTWGRAMFSLETYPDWARPVNMSSTVTDIQFPSDSPFNLTSLP